MKTKTADQLWIDFLSRLGSGSLLEVVCRAQTWLRENLPALSVKPSRGRSAASIYMLESFIDLDLHEYPLEYSGLDAKEEVASLRCLPNKMNFPQIAMFVRDLLWNAITVGSGKTCPNCGRQGELKVLVNASKPTEAYLACDHCPWIESIDGSVAEGTVAKTRPPTTKELEHIRSQLPAHPY